MGHDSSFCFKSQKAMKYGDYELGTDKLAQVRIKLIYFSSFSKIMATSSSCFWLEKENR